ncbi:MAG: sugar O-acetyltransferase [Eubacteriales bacterium]
MTEKEKREAGLLYDANFDVVLMKELNECKDLCYEFNLLRPSQYGKREALLRQLLGSVKSVLAVQSPFYCDFGYNIHVGKNFYTNHGLTILDTAKVTFGDNVFIAPYCGFYTAGHPIDADLRNQGLEYAKPITVGDNVWFGGGVQVLPGVTIGSDVVIGSGSVVTTDIPSHVVAVGNPCTVLRPITKEDRLQQ